MSLLWQYSPSWGWGSLLLCFEHTYGRPQNLLQFNDSHHIIYAHRGSRSDFQFHALVFWIANITKSMQLIFYAHQIHA